MIVEVIMKTKQALIIRKFYNDNKIDMTIYNSLFSEFNYVLNIKYNDDRNWTIINSIKNQNIFWTKYE